MKRAIALCLVFVAATAFGQLRVADGVYFAQEPAFAASGGWRDQVVVTVSGGKVTAVSWNGVSNLPGVADKKSHAAAGRYGMKAASKIGAEWDQQAKAVEDYIIRTQDLGFSKFNADGTTDAITGASIHVKPFFALFSRALASAPVARGIYRKDGWFYAQQAAFDATSGWKDTVLVTVVNGTVVDVLWNGLYKDATKKSKLVEATEGRYGMSRAAKKGEWNVQAAAVQTAIVSVQDPTKIPMKADGTTDAISGASLHPTAVTLAIEALRAAR